MEVTLNEECKERYHEVERKGLQYLVLFITDDGKEIRVDKTGELLNTCYLKNTGAVPRLREIANCVQREAGSGFNAT